MPPPQDAHRLLQLGRFLVDTDAFQHVHFTFSTKTISVTRDAAVQAAVAILRRYAPTKLAEVLG